MGNSEYSATLQASVQMPGICQYPAKCTAQAVNQGGTANRVVHLLYLFVLDRMNFSVQGVFYCKKPG